MDCYAKPKIPCPVCNARPEMPIAPMPARTGEKIDCYPVGMAYVPWQTWKRVYPLDGALCRGTIFSELDLPFVMGRCQ